MRIWALAVRGQRWGNYVPAYLLIAPAMILLTIYVFIPVGYTAYISVQDLHLGSVPTAASGQPASSGSLAASAHTVQTFYGLRNWDNLLFHDPIFITAARNTAVMVCGATIFGAVVALFAAVVATQRIPFIGFFRTVYFFPAALSQLVTGLVFLWLFDENFGLVNHLLGLIGMGPFLWQDDARYLLVSLTLAAGWIMASYNMPIYAAALQNIPRTLIEAAELDGASRISTFRHVVLPLIRPVSWFVLLGSAVAVTQMLGLYDALGQDNIGSSTLVKYMFVRAFYFNDIDYAGAIGCLLIIALTCFAVAQFVVSERGEHR